MPKDLSEMSSAELKQLAADREKSEKASGPKHSARFSIDLGDEKQVSLARRLGLIPSDEEKEEEKEEKEGTPKRGGYFKDED